MKKRITETGMYILWAVWGILTIIVGVIFTVGGTACAWIRGVRDEDPS